VTPLEVQQQHLEQLWCRYESAIDLSNDLMLNIQELQAAITRALKEKLDATV
jgi:hypothetical protein